MNEAASRGFDWLLLLDQDTSVTHDYLVEALSLARELRDIANIVAVVPKLLQRDRVLSPLLTAQWRKPESIFQDAYGVLPQRVMVFNSGAMIKTSALQQIGGFPEHFWLDFLDHATFHALQTQVGKVFIMQSTLEHDSSMNPAQPARSSAVSDREGNVLKASRDYYCRYGSMPERMRFIWLVIPSFGRRLNPRRDPAVYRVFACGA